MTLLGNLLQLQHINKWYEKATFSEAFEFKFASEEIQLVLEKKQMEDSWTICPRKHPCTVCITFLISYLYTHVAAWIVQSLL